MSEIKVNALTPSEAPEYTQSAENAAISNTKQVFDVQKKPEVDEYKTSDKTTNQPTNNTKSESYTPASELDNLDQEKETTQNNADTKKSAIKAEIADLIKNDKNISDNVKKEYLELDKEQKEKSEQLQKAKKELDDLKRNVDIAKAEIIRRQTEREEVKDESRKSEIDKEIKQYDKDISSDNKKITSLNSKIKSLKNSISSIDTKMEKLKDKIAKTSSETSKKIKEKEQELKDVDNDLENKLADIKDRKDAAEKKHLEELHTAAALQANYENIAGGYVSDGTVSATAAGALARAAGEIGVRERTGHNDGAEINKYRNGVANGAAWCASFVSWCYKGNDVFGYNPSVSGIMQSAQKKGKYAAKGSYQPKAGDVMIQKSNGASHTGIVESVDADGTIHTIEGNASNSVRRVTYKPGSKGYNQISGWVRMS